MNGQRVFNIVVGAIVLILACVICASIVPNGIMNVRVTIGNWLLGWPVQTPCRACTVPPTTGGNMCTPLNGYSFTGNGWANDAYLPNPNANGFSTAWRPWQTTDGLSNLPWILLWMDPAANGSLEMTIPEAYVLTGNGNGIFAVNVALDNRAQEELRDRNDPNANVSPFDVACAGDWSGQCKLNGSRLSMYLDVGKYSVLLADGTWLDMSTNWHQVLLPPKGDNTTFMLVINLHEGGNFKLHIGGAESDNNGGWHSQVFLPLPGTCIR